ncbi:putative F-box/LRR-repeat protein [Trifolium repens]|nr:putative F-box/LRR-repeat protein [Trifolium repens]
MENSSKKIKIHLPDSVLSNIFSKLGLKDLVKTSALSKLWRHEWQLRTDLNFDLCNMFDLNKVQQLPKSIPLFHGFQSEFVTRLDQFMLHYQGNMIDSIRVKFPLSYEHSDDVIGRLVSKGIAKGAKRIELLFAYDTCFLSNLKPYKFSFDMLSGTDSLTYLHLQNCGLERPLEFSGLKNLRTLVLQQVRVKQNRLEGLFSNCIHLVEFALDGYIIASNLSSIEYSCNDDSVHKMNIEAHMLSNFSFRGYKIYNHVGFSGLKNVTTIVLDRHCEFLHPTNIVSLLFSECLELQDVTFKNCKRIYDMNIISPKLRHLKIIECVNTQRIDINALNLASFEYNGYMRRNISVTAPRLLRLFWNAARREKNPYPFGPTITLQHIENLAMIMRTSQVAKVTEILVQYQNLRQLDLSIDGAYDPNMDYFWILDIAMASQHLQKLSVTIKNLHLENSHMVGFKRQRKEYAGFSHNGLKYVELRGCVCSTNVIEMASCLLRNASSLKQITFGSHDKFYIGAGRWTNCSDGCCWYERNLIHENLKNEVHEQCELIIF